MSSLKHPLALNSETRQVIAPMGKHFKGAVEYDPVRDKGKLICIHCLQANLTHRDEKPSIAGGNLYGWQSHFATIGTRAPKKPKTDGQGNAVPYVKNAHATDCVAAVLVPEEGAEPDKIDYTKGLKIYVDIGTIRRTFRNNATPVTRDDQTRRIVNTDPDLVDRERMRLAGPKDAIRAIKHIDADRLQKSVIVFEDETYAWEDFMIRKTGGELPFARWASLGSRLIEGKSAAVMVHADLRGQEGRIVRDGGRGWRLIYDLHNIIIPHPTDDRYEHTVKFRLNIRSERMFDMFQQSETGQFLALVRPESFPDRHNGSIHHVDITINDPRMVEEIDLNDLSHQSRLNAEKRRQALAVQPA